MKVGLLALLAAAAPPQQFDLVCSGGIKFQLLDDYRPHQFRLRVDLAGKRYCQDDCGAIKPIAEVQPAFIKFETESEADKVAGITRSRIVRRDTGRYIAYIAERRPSVIAVEAQCEPAPFSGFPEFKTKF